MRYSKSRNWLAACLLAVVLSACSGAYKTAGVRDAAVPLQTRTLTVGYEGTPEEAMQAVVRAFEDRGYTIRHTDSTLHVVSTEYTRMESGPSVALTARVLEEPPTRVELTGLMQSGIGSTAPIEKIGRAGSPSRQAWAELFLAATSLGTVVQYR